MSGRHVATAAEPDDPRPTGVTAGRIAAGTVTAGQIAAGAVTAGRLVAESVTSGRLKLGRIIRGVHRASEEEGQQQVAAGESDDGVGDDAPPVAEVGQQTGGARVVDVERLEVSDLARDMRGTDSPQHKLEFVHDLPSVGQSRSGTGAVGGAAALDTPPAGDPTVGEPTDTPAGSSFPAGVSVDPLAHFRSVIDNDVAPAAVREFAREQLDEHQGRTNPALGWVIGGALCLASLGLGYGLVMLVWRVITS